MMKILAIAANICLIISAILLWSSREGMPDDWEGWFIFCAMLIAPTLSLSALIFTNNIRKHSDKS